MDDRISTDRAIGALDARTTILEGRMQNLETRIDKRLESMGAQLESLKEAWTQTRGFTAAWRTLGYVIIGAGAVGSAVATLIHYTLHGF